MKRFIGFVDRNYWWILSVNLFIFALFIFFINLMESSMSAWFGVFLFAALFVLLFQTAFSPKRYFKLFLVFLSVFLAGFMMKKFHLAGAGPLLVMSTAVIVFMLIGQIFVSLFIKKNLFLKIMGAFASIVLALGYAGNIFKIQQWPGANLMLNIALPAFLIGSFVIVIGVQKIDFAVWQEQHRKFFIRNILLPWFFIFLFGATAMLFPEIFFAQLVEVADWGLNDYQLPE